MDISKLKDFSASLLALSDATRSHAPGRSVREAMMTLRTLVPFRSAWWGECSDAAADSPRRNWLHGCINLSPGFAQEWNRLADGDVFARESMRQLGSVLRVSGHDDPDPEVAAFSRKHALFHVMALTAELPGSGLMFFVALYRGEEAAEFTEEESALFSEYTTHLLHHWRRQVHDILLGAMPHAADALALVDAQAHLVYLGARLGSILHKAHPDWSGSALPDEMAVQCRKAPAVMALGRHQLRLQPCGELLVMALENRLAGGLTPREHGAAMLYAQGHSYKEIARMLGLSPATVRTYLRNAYLHLDVRNKVQLGSALRRKPAR